MRATPAPDRRLSLIFGPATMHVVVGILVRAYGSIAQMQSKEETITIAEETRLCELNEGR
jgi:hypothetical protein